MCELKRIQVGNFNIANSITLEELESQYENIVIDIENKAEEYAMDIGTTEALYINVEFLITNESK